MDLNITPRMGARLTQCGLFTFEKERGISMELYIDTKQIYYDGSISINNQTLYKGMSVSELEQILQTEITDTMEHVGHIIDGLFEDRQPHELVLRYKDDLLESVGIQISGFGTYEEAMKYLNEWLKDRGFTDKAYGDGHYKTNFGYITPKICSYAFNRILVSHNYTIDIEPIYSELPTRKFKPIQHNALHSVELFLEDEKYKLQRLTIPEMEQQPICNVIEYGPMSLDDCGENWNFNDRLESIYFALSKIENDTETILGILDTTYISLFESYLKDELYFDLDSLDDDWGLLAIAIDQYGFNQSDLTELSKYCLVYETIHKELPENKDLLTFMEDDTCRYWLFEAAASLTAKYVGIKNKEDITFVHITEDERVKDFKYFKKLEHFYINYRR